MGRQQGTLLQAQVATLQQVYLERFLSNSVERAGALAFGLSLLPHMPTPQVVELKAMADAAGVTWPNLLVANTFADASRAFFCSVVVASGEATAGGRLLVARNLDFPSLGILHKATAVFVYHHTEKGRHSFVSVGWPGTVGVVSGMNDAGLCLATLVSMSRRGVAPGMPFAMMYREILERCSTPQEALELVKRTPRTSANNLALAAPGAEALVVEFTPDKVAVRRAARGLLLATNHFRSQELASDPMDRCARFARLERDTAASRGKLDVAALKPMLDAVNQGDMTVQSMVFEPAGRMLHLAIGRLPASSGAYMTLNCAKLFAAK